MFKIFKRVKDLEEVTDAAYCREISNNYGNKLKALEDYLSVDFFHGDKSKPHYRKRKVVVKKLGRPRKNK